jgi:hypothetical protein
MPWVAAGAVAAAGISAYASSQASDAQTKQGQAAIAAQQQQQAITRGDLLPFTTAGQGAVNQLAARTGPGGDLIAPITMDQATLEQTPGYQFNLTQGLKATQNSAAARGLGVSGAAMKGAAAYATGLADNTYQNQFANAVTNQTNTYNRLSDLATTGENAAAQTGALGQQSASNISGSLTGIGNAQAAASLATGKAVGNAFSTAGQQQYYNGLYGPTGANNPNNAPIANYTSPYGAASYPTANG